ncbi:MAG: hypothetical protein WBG57_12770 [Ornithinimicrobium sp.]
MRPLSTSFAPPGPVVHGLATSPFEGALEPTGLTRLDRTIIETVVGLFVERLRTR